MTCDLNVVEGGSVRVFLLPQGLVERAKEIKGFITKDVHKDSQFIDITQVEIAFIDIISASRRLTRHAHC